MVYKATPQKAWQHFKTITWHKILVMQGCFKVGLYWQGMTHDLSKYSWTEFHSGMKYYQGTRSPNAAEREESGYSTAWLHHKGRNRHHYEYWTDVGPASEQWKIKGIKMPPKYVAEMIMDRIAASKVYKGKNYKNSDPMAYFNITKDYIVIHPETKKELHKILRMLEVRGEEYTFAYIRKVLLKKVY